MGWIANWRSTPFSMLVLVVVYPAGAYGSLQELRGPDRGAKFLLGAGVLGFALSWLSIVD